MRSIELSVPVEVFASIGETELQALAEEALLVRLYALDMIGSGRAAQLLGITRRDFLTDVLDRYNVS